jgi:hypothetical protein
MRSDQLHRTWTATLVKGLQKQYGITEEEARKKVEAWLEYLGRGCLLYPRVNVPGEDPSRPR